MSGSESNISADHGPVEDVEQEAPENATPAADVEEKQEKMGQENDENHTQVEEVEEEDHSDTEEESEDQPESTRRILARLRKKSSENKRLRERALAAEGELTRLQVAVEKGLPMDLAKRLVGGTKEELEKDAEALLELVHLRRRAPGSYPDDGVKRATAGNRPEDETDLTKIGERIYKR
ncbi:hypothetical protein GP475_08800 [Corynebacterium poyangense]|uniref:Scaffolding protein n=1 Tax=Corynebacterium poyangense TaxID=2684405 RepID=A0A7H0SQA0_9CORY|nr:hypothetical protein [Corynebacterium poyangense]QNQ90725.1 hypothetical protein GP475_08800 [Corynebacterium poyangense]